MGKHVRGHLHNGGRLVFRARDRRTISVVIVSMTTAVDGTFDPTISISPQAIIASIATSFATKTTRDATNMIAAGRGKALAVLNIVSTIASSSLSWQHLGKVVC